MRPVQRQAVAEEVRDRVIAKRSGSSVGADMCVRIAERAVVFTVTLTYSDIITSDTGAQLIYSNGRKRDDLDL